MDSEQEKAMALVVAVGCIGAAQRLLRKRRRRWWVRPALQRRRELSEFTKLIPHFQLEDPEIYFKYMRMSPDRYEHLLSLLSDGLTKSSIREAVSPSERLTITLVYLASGCSQQDLSFRFHRGRSTISSIVRETCDIIWSKLHSTYFRMPENEEEWRTIAAQYMQRWNFPNCVGSIDGKHFSIQCPKLTGSQYFNYKQHFSSLVLAMCDADYKFTYASFGSAGREGDAGVFGKSDLFQRLEENLLQIPRPESPPGSDIPLPFTIIGDEAFPLKPYLMRPFPGRGRVTLPFKETIYNYRLSRARRCIENAFGILVARWRIFRTPVIANIDNVECFIKATFVLHNYLRTEETTHDTQQMYIPPGFVDTEDSKGSLVPGAWRSESQGRGVSSMRRVGSNMTARSTVAIRDQFADYFISPSGSVPWQNKMVP